MFVSLCVCWSVFGRKNETVVGANPRFFIFCRDNMSSVNLMVSDTIKIPMNNTMKRLEMLLKGHPKMSEDTMTRFRKVRTLSISLSANV